MNSEPIIPDVVLDIYLDGQFIRTIRLDAAAFAQVQNEPNDELLRHPDSPHRPRRHSVVELPKDGRLRLALDLRRMPNITPSSGLQVTTLVYDTALRPTQITDAFPGGRVSTFTYDPRDSAPQPPQDQPPDEPHILG